MLLLGVDGVVPDGGRRDVDDGSGDSIMTPLDYEFGQPAATATAAAIGVNDLGRAVAGDVGVGGVVNDGGQEGRAAGAVAADAAAAAAAATTSAAASAAAPAAEPLDHLENRMRWKPGRWDVHFERRVRMVIGKLLVVCFSWIKLVRVMRVVVVVQLQVVGLYAAKTAMLCVIVGL
jgi:hypothetical protein